MKFQKVISLILAVMMLFSVAMPVSAVGEADASEETSTPAEIEVSGEADVKTLNVDNDSTFYRIFHLDCGRKYFSVDQIKALIDTLAENNYTHIELAIGNDGLRFLLDDMTVTANNTTYTSDAVTAGIQAGNTSYYNDPNGNALTQTEMDTIISYANGKGIGIIPLINTPGHMDAILDCMEAVGISDPAYNNSARTVDVTNTAAVNFTLALVNKYIQYFAGKGCTIFNMGCDEYANDVSNSGFAGLIKSGKYGDFVTYVNKMAAQVKAAGMTPMAFNDGIYYNSDTSGGAFNTDIAIAYWTPGWSGYSPASASFLAGKGHTIINTNDAWYYVLGRAAGNSSGYTIATAQNGVKNTACTDIPGNNDPTAAGCMICLWCDTPRASYSETEVNNVTGLLSSFSANNPSYFVAADTPTEPENVTKTDEKTGISVTAPNLIELIVTEIENPAYSADGATVVGYDITPKSATGDYTGAGTVTIPVPSILSKFNNIKVYDVNEKKFLDSVKVENDIITFTAAHFSEYDVVGQSGEPVEVTENKTITVTVGQEATDTISGYNFAGTYTTEDPSIAIVEVTGTDATEATTEYTEASVTCNTLISSDSKEWTAVSGYYYKADDGNYYPVYAKRSREWIWDNFEYTYTYTWGYSTTSSTSNVTLIGTQSTTDTSTTPNITVYTKSGTDATPASTTVTFTGVAVGTTNVTVGNTRYTIEVIAENLSTVTPLTVEYWITNLPVTADGATSKSISAQSAYGETGVDISTLVPASGTYAYGSVVYWKGTVLDADNKQTNANGVENDKTGSGKDFHLIRYYNGSWQYFYEADGTWNTISSTDQVVIYWLQPTEVTKEITTLVKDWGFAPDAQGDNENKVALTVAVVYPDGTVSPAEGDMYSTSTTLFNYWKDRDIGLVAPVNNSNYEIAKITVTNGTRDQSGTGKWSTTDTITWEKVTNEAGVQWYNETTYWDETVGGTPMVNGAISNITWPNYNTAKLVLIYLKPVHYDTNLTVIWKDDSDNGDVISTMEVAVSSDGTPTTFYNGLIQTSALPAEGVGGTFTLDDNAYVTNSSNVNQTFNKNISTVPGVADIYKTGLYQYVSAELSADGKTLTLHYNIDSSKLSKQYVVDFGLPVNVPLSDLIENSNDVYSVEITSGNATVNNDNSITYQPAAMLTGIATINVKLTFNDNKLESFKIGFVPATTVYYEDGFASYTGSWGENARKGTDIQVKQEAGKSSNEYGYDDKYANETTGPSNGTQASSETKGDTAEFTFTGTGVDIYANTNTETGSLMIRVKQEENTVKLLQVDTSMKDGGDATQNQAVTAYNVPVATINDLAHGTYTIVITHLDEKPVNLDGFRVYGTIALDTQVYKDDLEDNPIFIELRDQVLAGLSVTSKNDGQVNAALPNDVNIVIVSFNNNYSPKNAEDLLNNGPKNEIFLYKGQSLVFKITTDREVQIGLKAVNDKTNYTINGESKSISTSTDMFYPALNKGTIGEKTITITNNGDGILSITKLKVCDDPEAALATLTEEDLSDALKALGVETDPDESEEAETSAEESEESKETETTPSESEESTSEESSSEESSSEESSSEESSSEESGSEESSSDESSSEESKEPEDTTVPEETTRPEETTEPETPSSDSPLNRFLNNLKKIFDKWFK